MQPGKFHNDSRLIAEEMTCVHNVLLRIINSVYLQCINVEQSPDDVQHFVCYALEWARLVEEHHHTEETMIFPEIDQATGIPGLMDANIQQHAAFHTGLEAYERYLRAVKDGEEKYSGQKLRGLVDSFMPVLREHLNDEIATLLQLRQYEDKQDWVKWFAAISQKILAQSTDPKFKVSCCIRLDSFSQITGWPVQLS
jgi:hemerythrin-like domain-containing protein